MVPRSRKQCPDRIRRMTIWRDLAELLTKFCAPSTIAYARGAGEGRNHAFA